MRFQVLSLDLDGTLWDSVPALARAEQAVYAWLQGAAPAITEHYSPEALTAHRRALAMRRPDWAHDFTRLRRESIAELARATGHDAEIAESALSVFFAERSRVDVYPDTIAALERLRGRVRLVGVTNGNADVARIGLGHYFDYIVTPPLTGAAKPDPEVLHYVVRRSRVPVEAVAHVGDEPHIDGLCAQRAGMAAIWINRHGATWPELPPPQAEIRSLADLEAVLERL